jgi:hypothetical protein
MRLPLSGWGAIAIGSRNRTVLLWQSYAFVAILDSFYYHFLAEANLCLN